MTKRDYNTEYKNYAEEQLKSRGGFQEKFREKFGEETKDSVWNVVQEKN